MTTVDKVVEFAELSAEVWKVVSDTLGGVPGLRVLSAIPEESMKKALLEAKVKVDGTTFRGLSTVEAVQASYMWRVARRFMGYADVDVLAPACTIASGCDKCCSSCPSG